MPQTLESSRRSDCPINVALELVGDKWTLLVVRDLMLKGKRYFAEFLESGEGISTNILTDRLLKLEANGLVRRGRSREDGRRVEYRLTSKGVALTPTIFELILWAARHEPTAAPASEITAMLADREAYIRRMRETAEEP